MDLVNYYKTRAMELKVQAGGIRDPKAKQSTMENADAWER
jgi:hypothetical protein